MDPAFLNTRRLKAQHALMLSTSLSRCMVKMANDSLINIAVDYFGQFGPRKEKFLSYYYQGRVYQDLEDYESAMHSYLEADSLIQIILPYREGMSERSRMAFDNNLILASLAKQVPNDSILASARFFEDRYSMVAGFPWSTLALFYTRAGALSEAERALTCSRAQVDSSSADLAFLKTHAELQDSLGMYKEGRKSRLAFQEMLGQNI